MRILENTFLSVVLGDNGGIIHIADQKSGMVYLDAPQAESFRMKIDPHQGNIWKTDPGSENNIWLTDRDAEVHLTKTNNGITADCIMAQPNGTVVLRKTYTLEGRKLTVSAEIENHLENSVVISLIPTVVSGMIGEEKPLTAAWPFKTGMLYKDGVIDGGIPDKNGDVTVIESYPTPISMQYAAFFNEKKCIYCAVEDMTAEFKLFSYKSCADGTASFMSEQMPFAAPGELKKIAPTVLACFDKGDFTPAADLYREFLKKAGWIKPPQKSAVEYTGANGWTMNTYIHKRNEYLVKYTAESPAPVEETLKNSMERVMARTGFDHLWITGWHTGGFDTYYPDYEFSDALGGEAEFQKGVQQVHDLGGKIQAYVNIHMSDIESKWYNTVSDNGKINGERCAIRKADGGVWEETYPPSQPKDVAMCPMADHYRKAVTAAAKRLRNAGVDALYLDQLSEMRSYLCFDPSHGHRTPATAYYEGYTKILNEISAIMKEGGSDYFLCCEGECDCWGKWIDIFYGYIDTTFLPMSRYTLPSKIIGRELISFNPRLSDELENDTNYFSAAFLLGQPFVCHRSHVNKTEEFTNKNLKRYLALYKKYPDIFLAGKYQYHMGITGAIPPQIDYGVMLADNGNRASVQLYNRYGTDAVSFRFRYTPKGGKITAAYNAETGENMLSDTGEISLTLDPKKTVSVLFE